MLTDLYVRYGRHALTATNWLRKHAYGLYNKADDLHYYLERWVATLEGDGPW